MYRKRRKVQSFYGTSKNRFSPGFKLILVAIALLAVISAIITGAVLSNSASKSTLESYGRHNLTDFGGVKQPAEDYTALRNVKAGYANAVGADKASFKKEIADLSEGNAVVFKANDGNGNVFFVSESSAENGFSVNQMSSLTAKELAEITSGQDKISIA